jgi:tetratricopeptide (TPR) repeat protein
VTADTGPAAQKLHAALTALQQGKPEEARAGAIDALEGFSRAGDRTGAAAAHQILAMLGVMADRLDEALLHVDAAIPLRESTGDHEGVASLWQERLEISLRAGDLDAALTSARGQLDALKGSSDREGRAHASHQLAQVLLQAGDDAEAEALVQKALFDLGTGGTERARSALLLLWASIWIHRRNAERALGYAKQALDLARQAKNRVAEVDALQHLGVVHHLAGDLELARRVLEEALMGRELQKDADGRATVLRELANVELEMGEVAEGLGRLDYAARTLRENGNLVGEIAVLQTLQSAAEEHGDNATALKACRELLAAAERTRDREAEAAAHFMLATRLAGSTDIGGAIRHFERARDLQQQIGLSQEAAMSAGMMGQCVFVTGQHDEGIALLKGALATLEGLDQTSADTVREILKELEELVASGVTAPPGQA